MPCELTAVILGSCAGLTCADPIAGTVILPGSEGVSVTATFCFTDTDAGPELVSICVPSGLGVWEPGDPITGAIPNPSGGIGYWYGKFDSNGNFCLLQYVWQPPVGQ